MAGGGVWTPGLVYSPIFGWVSALNGGALVASVIWISLSLCRRARIEMIAGRRTSESALSQRKMLAGSLGLLCAPCRRIGAPEPISESPGNRRPRGGEIAVVAYI